MKGILTLTMNPSVDMNSGVEHVVAGRKLRCKAPEREPGGGGINVSRAIHKLGGTSIAFYPAGGPTGRMLQQLLDRERIKHYPIPIEGWSRENLHIIEESTGQQFRFGMPGPLLAEEEWQRCIDQVLSLDPLPAYVVASGSLPPGVPGDFYGLLAERIREAETRLIVDTSGEALRRAVGSGLYLLKPNMREIRDLTGHDIRDEAQLEKAARSLVDKGFCEVVVISLGAAGAWLVTAEGSELLRAPTVPVQSKVGAGDSMVGGLVLSLAQGKPLREAVRFGIAAGTAAVMTPGTELCRREDAERLYRQMVSSNPSAKDQ